MKHPLITLATLLLPALVTAQYAREMVTEPLDEVTRSKLEAALAGEHRSERNKARDQFRHPRETLEFFGLRSDMTVVEIWPGGGWYSEVLAPVLRENGKFFAAHWPVDSPRSYVPAALQRYREKLASAPEAYDGVIMTHIGPGSWEMVEAGSADLVLTFRSVHNWMAEGNAQDFFDAFYAALKPGGILGVVQHRGDPAALQDPKAASGYVTEAWVLSLASTAGFETLSSSEINANPSDLRSYPEGVWTLPPNSRLKDTPDGPKYEAIGESDRMTLKFRKPAAE
jgi:predicted methyltransferase